jgi:hypothetical protein
MLELKRDEALELIKHGQQTESLLRAGGNASLTKHEVEAGYIVTYRFGDANGIQFVYFDKDNEPTLHEVAEQLAAQQEDVLMREIELYRWGVKKPEDAGCDSFAGFCVLITDLKTGAMNWLTTHDGIYLAKSISEAKEFLRRLKPGSQFQYKII